MVYRGFFDVERERNLPDGWHVGFVFCLGYDMMESVNSLLFASGEVVLD